MGYKYRTIESAERTATTNAREDTDMAIDLSKIEGYREDMTAEEKLALLEKYEPEQPKPVGKTYKAEFDKVSSEAAALRKQLRERMTDDEQKEEERRAEQEKIRAELETLRKEKLTAGYRANFLSLKYDDESAESAAQAMADGDMDAVFKSFKKHMDVSEKSIRAQILKDTPTPPAGKEDTKTEQEKLIASIRASMGLPAAK